MTTVVERLWPEVLLVKDDLLPESERLKLFDHSLVEFKKQGRWPSLNVPCEEPPRWLANFRIYFDAAFEEYCREYGVAADRFDLVDFNITAVESYSEKATWEQNYCPHHDQAAGGTIAAIYYIDCYEAGELPHFVGGDLSIYRKMSILDYPDHCINIQLKRNRLAFFPAHLIHQVNPYFGNERHRLVFAMIFNLNRDILQNKKPRRI